MVSDSMQQNTYTITILKKVDLDTTTKKNVAYWKLVMDKARQVKGSDIFAVTEVWDDPEIVDR